jgi:CheY-like chemotaxis protein
VAEDGLVALRMWRSGRYGLLLTDCHMPNMDGFELTQAIRHTPPDGAHFPIVAVTANAMQGEAERCRERGMNDYLSKPLRLRELAPMIAKWLPSADAPAEPLQPEVSAAEPLVWDSAKLPQLVGDNPVMHARLLEKFLLNAKDQVPAVLRAAAADECDIMADVTHTLKSAARTVGAMALGDLCQKMEAAGRAGDGQTGRALAGALEAAYAAAEKAIQAHLARQGDAARVV